MALNQHELEALASYYQKELVGAKVSHLVLVSPSVFAFHLSRGGKLVFSFDGPSPYVNVSQTLEDVTSLSSSFYLSLRKEAQNARIMDVEVWNEDRILVFVLEAISATFKPVTRYLVSELLPGKSNFFLLDEDKCIMGGFRMGAINETRALLVHAPYIFPEKKEFKRLLPKKEFSFAEYQSKISESEALLIEKRKKEIYKPLFDFFKRKERSLKKKLLLLDDDVKKAESHLHDGDYGNFIYTDIDSIHPETGKMDYYGEEVALDPRFNAVKNAELFFKRAKKAKTALAISKENKDKTVKELESLEEDIALSNGASEEYLALLSEKYGFGSKNAKKKKNDVGSALLPYFVTYNGVTYLYGKSAKQNDFLTFHFDTSRNHGWLHVEGDSGAHVIIKKDHPNEDEVSFGVKLALLASGLEEGMVSYSLRKDVRNGSVPGQAVLLSFRSIRGEVDEEAKAIFANAKKVSLK